MSIIKDTFFGGAEKKAAKAQQQGIERGIEATERATAEAKAAATPLFGQARQDLQQGFQGALDVFGQSLPAQVQAFRSGNVGAQEQLLAGLPQFQNAILGGNVDFSQLQPTQVQTPDLGFFQQQLPSAIQPQQTTVPNSGLGFFTPDNPVFDGRIGPFEMAPTQGSGLANTGFNPQSQVTSSSADFIPRGPGDTFGRFLESQKRNNQPNNLFALGGF